MSALSIIKGFGARAAVKAVKYAPHILVGLGIGLVTVGTVEAVKGAKNSDHIFEEHEAEMDRIEDNKKMAEEKKAYYTTKNEMEEKAKAYTSTAVKLVKANWKPIVLYISGVACILTGHNLLNRRYLAMAASYAGLHKSYFDYRKRVVDELGKDEDFRFANGAHTESYDYVDIDENGESKDVHAEANNVVDHHTISPYAVFFDEMYSTMWTPNPINNLDQIRMVQDYWNEPTQFEHRKFVYYHEVLRDLGIWDRLEEEKQKQFVGKGWVWGCGDNYIDLGIFDASRPKTPAIKDAIMGWEPSVLIEPNLDGDVATLL